MDDLAPVVWDDVLTDALLGRHRAHPSPAAPPAVHSDLIADAITWDRTSRLSHQLAHAFAREDGLHGEPMAAARQRYASLAESDASHPGHRQNDATVAIQAQSLQREECREGEAETRDAWRRD